MIKADSLKPFKKLSKPPDEIKFSMGATLCMLDKNE